jgi:type I restriction enzyme R subunit
MSQLGQAKPRLLCSLVHKFGRRDVDDFDAFIKELEAQPSPTVGECSCSWTSATARRAASCTA